MSKKQEPQSPSEAPSFEQLVRAALRSSDWFFPETERDVATMESLLENEPDAPDGGLGQANILEGDGKRFLRCLTSRFVTPIEITDSMARAAREGNGLISAEVERLMLLDRVNAETPKK